MALPVAGAAGRFTARSAPSAPHSRPYPIVSGTECAGIAGRFHGAIPMTTDTLLLGMLLYGVFPLWLIVGVADALCHRRSDLPHSSGVHESALHLVMLAQIGAGTLLILFCEITAPVLLVLALLVIVHTATTYWDIAYTLGRRRIGAFEQLVHGWLEVLPFVALAILAVVHWDETQRLLAGDTAQWHWRLRAPPLPWPLTATVIALSLVFAAGPAVLEFLQAWRARRDR